jgi:FtsH-binding integral membrane protein
MNSDPKNKVSTDRFPPSLYVVIVGLVAWMAVAAWSFAGPGYAGFSLAVVTGFLMVAIAIPFVLWRVSRDKSGEQPKKGIGFSEWRSRPFETWQDRVKGSNAAVQIILPIAAAAVGMTAFAIIFHYAATHASA